MRKAVHAIVYSALVALAPNCGGGGGSDGSDMLLLLGLLGGDGTNNGTYTVGGTASGLNTDEYVVLTNGTDEITVSANESFAFNTRLTTGETYNVQVSSTNALACTAGDNTGTIASQNITDVSVVCGTPRILNVQVTDLDGYGSLGTGLAFQNNGADDLSVTAFNTPTAFTTQVVEGASYSVTTLSQPAGPDQVCSPVTSSSGTMPASAHTVTFGCSTTFYTIGVSVTGLEGSGLRLRNNGNAGDELTPGADGSYDFSTQVVGGLAYNVTIEQHPTNLSQTCSLGANASGTASGNTTVSIACSLSPFTVGGTVTGLGAGEAVTLQLNGGNNTTITEPTSVFVFNAIDDGSSYAVTVLSNPSGKGCYVTNGAGTLAGANVTNVAVTCGPCIGGGGTKSIDVSWTASRSYDVNTATGGFHRIFYDTLSNVSKSDSYVDVANTTSTTTGTITDLWPGCTYYVRVAGYSALNSTGGDLSAEQSISIPLE